MTDHVPGQAAPVSVVVFDLGGVVCRWLPDRRLLALSEISGLPPATIDAQVFGSGWDDACERGQFTTAEAYDHLRTILGLADAPDIDAVLRAAWAQAYEPSHGVLGLLPMATCPVAMLTNNGPILEEALSLELEAVGHAFDRILLSWRLEATKPSAECFAAATEALDAEPSEVLFIDDSADNVTAAQAFGWRAHHFTDELNLRVALFDAGVLRRGPSFPKP